MNSRIVWKFPLHSVACKTAIESPQGATPLNVAWYEGRPTVWMLCDPHAPRVTRSILAVNTGQPMLLAESSAYLGTVIDESDEYILHIFDLGEQI